MFCVEDFREEIKVKAWGTEVCDKCLLIDPQASTVAMSCLDSSTERISMSLRLLI
jgi:hypothetical protein